MPRLEGREETGAPEAGARRWMRGVVGRFALGGATSGGTGSAGSISRGEAGQLLAFGRYNRAYFRRWLVLGALIGVVAGLGAILFAAAIAFCTQHLLGGIAGFSPPGRQAKAGGRSSGPSRTRGSCRW